MNLKDILDNTGKNMKHFINLDIDSKNRFDMAKFMSYENDSHDPLTSSFLSDNKRRR